MLLAVQIPEHTWGLDTKQFLNDNINWGNKDFHTQLAAHAPNYEANINQWQRQRGYMTWALEALDQAHASASGRSQMSAADAAGHESRAELLASVKAELRRQHELTDVEGYDEHPVGEPLRLKSQFWEIEVNTTTGNSFHTSHDPVSQPLQDLVDQVPLVEQAAWRRAVIWLSHIE